MANPFSNAKPVQDEKVEDDFIPSGAVVFPTDIYKAKIKYAYVTKSGRSESRGMALSLEINGKELTKITWMTNGQGGVTYVDKKTKEKKNLPGYNQMNSLSMLLLGKEVGDLDTEERKLTLYDPESKKEIPQSVECFIDLHGMELQVALQEQIQDKTKKNENTGEYEPTGETRHVNEFVKFFPEDKLVTISEIKQYVESLGGDFNEVLADGDLNKAVAKMEDGSYASTWIEKNRGSEPWDRSTKGVSKEGGSKSFEGSKSSDNGGGQSKSTKNLFDD